MAGRAKKSSADEFLKEQERISLAEELMDLALMAKGTQKLFALIHKECVFDLDKLQSKMNGLTKAERDALEIKQLFDVVNELTAKKKEADELADKQEKELERQREEAKRLKLQMEALGGEKDSEQQKLLEELQGLFETEREQLIAEQEQLRNEQIEQERLKAQQEIERLTQEQDTQQEKLSNELSKLEKEKRALEEREKERLKKAEQNQKQMKEEAEQRENEMQQQINKLISDLSDAREKVAELESSQSKQALEKMEEKIGKLYWVNKELIQQIKERDTQAKRLQGDLVTLQYEDQLKNLHIDTLDAKGREKQHQRDILLLTKRELEDTNQRLDKLSDDHKDKLESLQSELASIRAQLADREEEIGRLSIVLEDWRPKVGQLAERDNQLQSAREETQRTQLSFLKVKEQLEKERRRCEDFISQSEEREKKNQSEATKHIDSIKKTLEQSKKEQRSKEKKMAHLYACVEEREKEIASLRARNNDLQVYLTKSIAISKQLEKTALS